MKCRCWLGHTSSSMYGRKHEHITSAVQVRSLLLKKQLTSSSSSSSVMIGCFKRNRVSSMGWLVLVSIILVAALRWIVKIVRSFSCVGRWWRRGRRRRCDVFVCDGRVACCVRGDHHLPTSGILPIRYYRWVKLAKCSQWARFSSLKSSAREIGTFDEIALFLTKDRRV